MINDIINILVLLPSQHVIYGMLSTVLCIAGAWIYGNCSQRVRLVILYTIGYLVVFNEIVFQLYMIYYGIWSPNTSLPLELCYISALLIPIYARNKDNRDLKNWFFFAGFGGSLFAFINTNLSEQEHIYVSIHYFFAHGLVIFIMLSIVLDGYRPVWKDYFNTIKWTIVLLVIILIINSLLGSNYMFTFEKPAGVNFTLLMPEWPYYYLIMLSIGLSFYTIMMLASNFLTKEK
ncbi:MAG: TIGR02206 family membrane protein [Candidatus Neomarinimicrobiota bacterium]